MGARASTHCGARYRTQHRPSRGHTTGVQGSASRVMYSTALEGEESEELEVLVDAGEGNLIVNDTPARMHLVGDFHPVTAKCRAHFEERFADPRSFEGRFVWDYWHVPGQYTLMRTPAEEFFPEEVYGELEAALLEFGQQNLGCQSISPIWLSYYISGCKQELHADVAHGPWAFVLSLTPWESRKFSGGETFMLRPEVLGYWTGAALGAEANNGLELPSMVETVPPEMGQLLVFDGRLPHGVKEVHGVMDPSEARVVLHGWFTDLRPFIEGTLTSEGIESALDAALSEIYDLLEAPDMPPVLGAVIIRLTVSPDGFVESYEFLTDTLVPLDENVAAVYEGTASPARDLTLKTIITPLVNMAFEKSDGYSLITVPFDFK